MSTLRHKMVKITKNFLSMAKTINLKFLHYFSTFSASGFNH